MAKIFVLGAWHLGSVVGSCLAEAGNEVHLWDQNERVAASWSQGKPPLHEPGLSELAGRLWQKRLFWAGDKMREAARSADWIVLAYDTPIDEKDQVLLGEVERGFDAALEAGIQPHARFFFTSQLPAGTSRRLRAKILARHPEWKGHVIYMPENLKLGEAVHSFQNPDRAVLGLDTLVPETKDALVKEFQTLTGNNRTPLNIMSLESAEMVKHALNAFMATCVVFANELSAICQNVGADAWQVMTSLKQDSRVGPKAYLRPGLGFAGGTLGRDVMTLSRMKGGELFKEIYRINSDRNEWVLDTLRSELPTLKGAQIVLLGVTYKPNTSTVRRSPALDIGALLRTHGATCVALDPLADLNELSAAERGNLPFELLDDASKAFKNADAAVVVTEWPQFANYDWAHLGGMMKSRLLIDTKNMFNGSEKLRHFARICVPGRGCSPTV